MSTAPVLAVDVTTRPEAITAIRALAPALETGGIGALVLSDGGLHPIHVAASLAPLTRTLALIPRTDAVYVEPFHLATQLMSLDHVSAGRAGWLLEARRDEAAAGAVGRDLLDAESTAQESADVLATARLIWDSWADDAVVKDVERGVYVDASRLQYVDAQTATFSVRGPSITPRSPQGLVPVLLADADRGAAGEETAGRVDGRALDVAVDPGASGEAIAQAVRDAIRAASRGSGAAPGAVPVHLIRLTGLDPAREDLADRLAGASSALRADGTIAPASPAPAPTFRDQLGLPRPEAVIDPARRSDRARRADAPAARQTQETR